MSDNSITLRNFSILSLNVSEQKGEQKRPVDFLELQPEHGIVGDAHAGTWHRQVSLLAEEDIATIRGKGIDIAFGDFAENITTIGVDLSALPIGARLFLGEAELEVTQIGKKCHHGCAIFQTVGDCVMPRKGIFARVIRGGVIHRDSRCQYQTPVSL